MIYELRIYEATPGRLEDLNRRFADITLEIWNRLGIKPIGFWTTLVGPSNNALHYILEWENMADRQMKWTQFLADAEWIARKAKTEQDGVLVARAENIFLAPTGYGSELFSK